MSHCTVQGSGVQGMEQSLAGGRPGICAPALPHASETRAVTLGSGEAVWPGSLHNICHRGIYVLPSAFPAVKWMQRCPP